jgi:aminoglycoside/choline kinase family phosphotransferase
MLVFVLSRTAVGDSRSIACASHGIEKSELAKIVPKCVLSWSESPPTINDTMSERLDRARQWVQKTLGVQSVELQPASSDASFRRYFRVRTGNASMILMDAPPEREDCRPYVAVGELLEQAGVHVPTIHARDLDSGFLLLEDLGDRLYLDELDENNASTLYGDALAALLAMQLRVPAGSVPRYDSSLVMRELSLFGDWFLGKHLGIETAGTMGDVLSKSFRLLTTRFSEQARVFVHRDYHSRNLMRTLDRNPGVLDFQDAVGGPAAYDVVSLLRDVYIEWPQERVEAWLLEYHRDALIQGVPIPTDAAKFFRDADLIGAQRHLKIAGIFCRLYYRDGKADYLRDIPLTLRYLIDECRRQPELASLHTLLEDLNVLAKAQESIDRTRDPAGNQDI